MNETRHSWRPVSRKGRHENRAGDSLYKIGTEGTGASSTRNHYLDRASDDFRTFEPEMSAKSFSELQLVASQYTFGSAQPLR